MLSFQCIPFHLLSNSQLYETMMLRQEVFVVEQNCPYQDADGKDLEAHHLLLWEDEILVGYARLLPKGVSYPKYCSMGRIVTKPSHRGQSYGRMIIKECLRWCEILYPGIAIKISAQSRLERLYQDFGFELNGDYYLEDDIPHSGMVFHLT